MVCSWEFTSQGSLAHFVGDLDLSPSGLCFEGFLALLLVASVSLSLPFFLVWRAEGARNLQSSGFVELGALESLCGFILPFTPAPVGLGFSKELNYSGMRGLGEFFDHFLWFT